MPVPCTPPSTADPSPVRETDALFAAVYDRLKAMASRQRARAGNETQNTTALVHELYLKLNANDELRFASPAQFFDYAAKAMRHILVDRARERLTMKHGGQAVRETGAAALESPIATAESTLELDAALRRLESADARSARLVALHYFAGLSLPEIATLTGYTTRTLNRDLRFARAFLNQMLG